MWIPEQNNGEISAQPLGLVVKVASLEHGGQSIGPPRPRTAARVRRTSTRLTGGPEDQGETKTGGRASEGPKMMHDQGGCTDVVAADRTRGLKGGTMEETLEG